MSATTRSKTVKVGKIVGAVLIAAYALLTSVGCGNKAYEAPATLQPQE